LKIHVSVGTETPRRGHEFKTACGETIKHVAFPFSIEGDCRAADVTQLGNCFKCRRKLKIPEGKHVVFGAAEAQEEML
jgi:hypothetical protein